jgi:hypothetical protein
MSMGTETDVVFETRFEMSIASPACGNNLRHVQRWMSRMALALGLDHKPW